MVLNLWTFLHGNKEIVVILLIKRIFDKSNSKVKSIIIYR